MKIVLIAERRHDKGKKEKRITTPFRLYFKKPRGGLYLYFLKKNTTQQIRRRNQHFYPFGKLFPINITHLSYFPYGTNSIGGRVILLAVCRITPHKLEFRQDLIVVHICVPRMTIFPNHHKLEMYGMEVESYRSIQIIHLPFLPVYISIIVM